MGNAPAFVDMKALFGAAILMMCSSCDPGNDGRCLEVELVYEGTATGALYVREDGPSTRGLRAFASSSAALESLRPSTTMGQVACASGGAVVDETIDVIAWIDVDGDDVCDAQSPSYDQDCQPDAEDPRGTAAITFTEADEYRVVTVTLRDQP
jgi:hypothetical protein